MKLLARIFSDRRPGPCEASLSRSPGAGSGACRPASALALGRLARFSLVAMFAVASALRPAGAAFAAEDGANEVSEPAPAQGGEEPGVARVSYIEGEASYFRADGDDWTAVSVNAPLVTGDRFYSGPKSRAEVQIAPGLYARISSETEVDMLELGPSVSQVRLAIGLAAFNLRRAPGDDNVEFDTPGAALVARAAGTYRVNVDADGNTTVFVRDGEIEAYVGNDRHTLGRGQGATIEGTGQDARLQTTSSSDQDDFDRWATSRTQRVDDSRSYQYVSDDVYGAEDLDEYGTWQEEPTYGPVWRPSYVAPGWAPYTNGRWVWQDPWGWTWVDYQPWGWAPCHYGRWVYTNGFWGWAPGPLIHRPVFAPALVSFFGFNAGGVSVSVGIGPSVGWVPLGWGEPCFPWWGGFGGIVVGRPWWGGWGGPRVVNNVVINQTNITNINVNNVHFTNFDRPNAFTTVTRDGFVSGSMQRSRVPAQQMQQFRPFSGAVPVMPQRQSLPAAAPAVLRSRGGLAPPQTAFQRAAVTLRTPPAAPPKFDQKLALVRSSGGKPLPPAELHTLGSGRPIVPTVQASGRNAVTPRLATQPPSNRPGAQPGQPGSAPAPANARAGEPPWRGLSVEGRSPSGTVSGAAPSTAGSHAAVPRPPASVDARPDVPVSPRAREGSHTPYVARRPAEPGSAGSQPPAERATQGSGAPAAPQGQGHFYSQRQTYKPAVRSESPSSPQVPAPHAESAPAPRPEPHYRSQAPGEQGGGSPPARVHTQQPSTHGTVHEAPRGAPEPHSQVPTMSAPHVQPQSQRVQPQSQRQPQTSTRSQAPPHTSSESHHSAPVGGSGEASSR